jgi:hypothetical protein
VTATARGARGSNKFRSEQPDMTKSDPLALIERVQTMLAQADAPFAQLEQGAVELQRLIASSEADLEVIASRRKIEMTTATPAVKLSRRLNGLKKNTEDVEQIVEIASTILVALETRIAADREAARAEKHQAAYDEALELRDGALCRVKEFLARFGAEGRLVLRNYAGSELKTIAANKELPPGASPIPSIEFERKGALQVPKTTTREFRAFVEGRRIVAEQGHVQASPRADGKWNVFLPGGSTSGGQVIACDLVDHVDVRTETDATPWPVCLASSLAVPAFYVTEPPGWAAPTDISYSPHEILRALDRLETKPSHHFAPRVEERTMRLAVWRQINGDAVEAEPAPVQNLAAE